MTTREPRSAPDPDPSLVDNPYAIGILATVVVSLALVLLVGTQFLLADLGTPGAALTPVPDENTRPLDRATPTPRVVAAPAFGSPALVPVHRATRATPRPEKPAPSRVAHESTPSPAAAFAELVARLSKRPAPTFAELKARLSKRPAPDNGGAGPPTDADDADDPDPP